METRIFTRVIFNSKQILGLPVLSLSSGKEIGVVEHIVVNPRVKSVEMFLIKDTALSKAARVGLLFHHVFGMGEYALTVKDGAVLIGLEGNSTLDALIEEEIHIIGTKVVTEIGHLLGEAKEYHVDTVTGAILNFSYTPLDGSGEVTVESNEVRILGPKLTLVSQDAMGGVVSPKEESGPVEEVVEEPFVEEVLPSYEEEELVAQIEEEETEEIVEEALDPKALFEARRAQEDEKQKGTPQTISSISDTLTSMLEGLEEE